MTDRSIIQQARDVLAKWGDATTPRPWAIEESPETGECRIVMVDDDLDAPTVITVTSGGMTRADASLIVGTAGNPELLDAMDSALAEAADYWPLNPPKWGERMAAAIIAADERMTS